MYKKKIKRVYSYFVVLVVVALCVVGCTKTTSKNNSKAKNIIIFIGDGMGSPQISITSYTKYKTQDQLYIEKMPFTGFVKTHAANNWITDSASGATALATGHKTNVGMVGVTPDSVAKETTFERARKLGMKTGLVATSHITDATPACFVSHVPNRTMKNIIAEQMINSGTDVILGGGIEFFLPQNDKRSVREDDKNLIDSAASKNYSVALDSVSLERVNSGKVLGLFSVGGLKTQKPEPSLAQMTRKAIQLLKDSDKGFILMVEGSQIDWRGHSNDIEGVIEQTVLFDEAVKVGLDFAKEDGETLILVTADHETGGITLNKSEGDNPFSFDVKWSTGGHTGIPVPIFAFGPNANLFTGVLDNTDVAKKVFSFIITNSNE